MRKSYPTTKSQPMRGKCILVENKKRFKINHPDLLALFLELHCNPGDDMTIWFESKRPKRTEMQNNYMHLYFSLIGRSSGHTMKQIKDWANQEFLSKGITEVFGIDVREVKSTSDLTRGELCEYLMRIEESTEIPTPNSEPFLKPLTQKEYDELTLEQKRAYGIMKSKIFIDVKGRDKSKLLENE
jgi:hypothetical protein